LPLLSQQIVWPFWVLQRWAKAGVDEAITRRKDARRTAGHNRVRMDGSDAFLQFMC
jgi:hypothetical protein